MSDSFTGSMTGGLIDPGPQDYGKKMSAEERRRQALINSGLASINAVYGGGTVPQYSVATQFDPSKDYYRANKQGQFELWQPHSVFRSGNGAVPGDPGLTMILGFGGGKEQSPAQRVKSAISGGRVFTREMQTYGGFTPEFYNQRAKDYVNYAMPQLANQYRDTQANVMYGMANRGLLGSTAEAKAAQDLNYNLTQAKQGITDAGRAQAQQLQDEVEASRQRAIQQLYQTANPAAGTQAAISAFSQFQQPSAFVPIANAFTGLLNQYAASRVLNPSGGSGLMLPYGDTTYNTAAALPGVTQYA